MGVLRLDASHSLGLLRRFFPAPDVDNLGFYVVNPGSSKPFSALMTDCLVDRAFWGSNAGQYFPRYSYRPRSDGATLFESDCGGFERVDNITHQVWLDYCETYGSVTKDDIFYYVYGLLHSPEYRQRFEGDLKKTLPRLPRVQGESFHAFSEAGRALAAIHVGYETAEAYPLIEDATPVGDARTADRIRRINFAKSGGKEDRSMLVVHAGLTLVGVPIEAYEYQLGARSAIEWVMERYQASTDKASGIVNDPNDWADEVDDPRYIVDLLKRIVTVSIETMKIVKALPAAPHVSGAGDRCSEGRESSR